MRLRRVDKTALTRVPEIADTQRLDSILAIHHLQIMVSASFADRPLKKLCLFDVDGTLTPARQACQLCHLVAYTWTLISS